MIVPMAPRRQDTEQELAIGHQIARNMQALLRANGWTQGQLAYKAGLTQSGISALMVGRRNPSLLSVHKVASALGIPIEELAGFKPLQIPEQRPPETDRLGSVEGQVEQLAGRFDRLEERFLRVATALESVALGQSPSESADKPRRGGSRDRKAS